MLLVLPLQFATAAAASYCRHESNATVKHYGHHEHKHEATAAESGIKAPPDQSPGGAALGDTDCEYCHLAASYPFLQAAGATHIGVAEAPEAPVVMGFGSRDPDTLDKPNWNSLASIRRGFSAHT